MKVLTTPRSYGKTDPEVFAMLRASGGKPIGHTGLLYPYPFMDLQHLGWGKLLRNAAVLLILFFLLGCMLVGLGFLVG